MRATATHQCSHLTAAQVVRPAPADARPGGAGAVDASAAPGRAGRSVALNGGAAKVGLSR
jgi:hypothetical protein